MMVIVPNYIADEINARLDAEIEKHPRAARDRDELYRQLVSYVNDHGVIPDFSLEPRDSVSGPQGEDAPAAECAAPQSGDAVASPNPSPTATHPNLSPGKSVNSHTADKDVVSAEPGQSS